MSRPKIVSLKLNKLIKLMDNSCEGLEACALGFLLGLKLSSLEFVLFWNLFWARQECAATLGQEWKLLDVAEEDGASSELMSESTFEMILSSGCYPTWTKI